MIVTFSLSDLVRNHFSFYGMRSAQAIVGSAGSVSEGWSLHGPAGGEKAYLDAGIHICCCNVVFGYARNKAASGTDYPLIEMAYPDVR